MSKFKKAMNNALLRRNTLARYIGKEFNAEIKTEIESMFSPYTIIICDMDYYYLEICLINRIRCVLVNRIISNLCFN